MVVDFVFRINFLFASASPGGVAAASPYAANVIVWHFMLVFGPVGYRCGFIFLSHFNVGCVSGDYSDIFGCVQPMLVLCVCVCNLHLRAALWKTYDGHTNINCSFNWDDCNGFALFTPILDRLIHRSSIFIGHLHFYSSLCTRRITFDWLYQ